MFAGTISSDSVCNGDIERVSFKIPFSRIDASRVTSGVLFLRRYSSLHAMYPLETLLRRICPSLPLGQFRYFTDSLGVPVAFCNWAWLRAPVLDDVLATGRDLRVDEFDSGDLPFFYEFLAPFGHCRAVVRDLRGLSFFEGLRIPAIRGGVYDTPHIPRVKYFQF